MYLDKEATVNELLEFISKVCIKPLRVEIGLNDVIASLGLCLIKRGTP